MQSVQPDLMPAVPQVSPFDLVQNNDGWDNDWANDDEDNAANWFDNDNNIQQADPLQQKEEECQALKQQIDTLISARAELESKVKEMKETNEKLLEKVATLESISHQTVHCQTEEEVPPTSIPVPQVEPEPEVEESLKSPPPNVFTWDAFAQPSSFDSSDFFATASSNPQDFFDQPSSEIPASRTQDIFATEILKENTEGLKLEIKTLQENTVDLERQVQLMRETEVNMRQQISDLETIKTNLELDYQSNKYEKSLLEEQINQLPSMDAFNSLQNVNEDLNSELQKLKEKLNEWPSSEELDNLKKANEDLKLKLASIGESQNEQYEQQVQELYGQIENLQTQLKEVQDKYDHQIKEKEDEIERLNTEKSDVITLNDAQTAELKNQVTALENQITELQSKLEDKAEIPQIVQEETVSDTFFGTEEKPSNTFTGFFDDTALQPASSFFDSPPTPAVQFEVMTQQDDNNLQQELEGLKEKLKHLEAANSDLELKLQQADNSLEIEQLKAALDEQKSVIEQWNAWAAEKTIEINQLNTDKEELQSANTVQESQLQESKAKIEELNSEIAKQDEDKTKELQDEIERLNTEKSEVFALNEAQIAELKNHVTTLENQITELQSKLEAKAEIPQIVQEVTVQEQLPSTSSFFDAPTQEPSSTGNLLAPEPTVEKGLSASSYFDQFGGTVQEEFKVEETNASVFEATTEDNTEPSETIDWYKTQLEQYQQAINDWQVWSENQMKDVATLQESLAYYTTLAEEKQQVPQESSEELNGLRAAVRAKEIEVEDLTETLDRLKTEKSNLEQEMTELTMENQELKREKEESTAEFDYALYEETKQSLDETSDKLSQVKHDLSVKNVEIQELTKLKESQEFQLSSLQNDLSTLKQALEQSRETSGEKDKALEDLKKDLENAKSNQNVEEIEALKAELEGQKSVIDQWNTWAEEKTEEINQLNSDKEELQKSIQLIETELEESKKRLEQENAKEEMPVEEPIDNKLKEEMEEQRKALEEWNTWAAQRTEEYNQLLEAYNQYVVSHQALEAEIERLNGVNADLETKIQNADESSSAVQSESETKTLAYQEEIERLKNEITGLAQKMTIPNDQAFVDNQAKMDDKAGMC